MLAFAAVFNTFTALIAFRDHSRQLSDDRLLLERVNVVAESASREAHRAILLNDFRTERICSRSNQGQACRDLVDRVLDNASKAQFHKIACLSLESLAQTREIRKILIKSRCP